MTSIFIVLLITKHGFENTKIIIKISWLEVENTNCEEVCQESQITDFKD